MVSSVTTIRLLLVFVYRASCTVLSINGYLLHANVTHDQHPLFVCISRISLPTYLGVKSTPYTSDKLLFVTGNTLLPLVCSWLLKVVADFVVPLKAIHRM